MKRQRKLKCILLTEISQSEKATLNELYDSLRCNGKTLNKLLGQPNVRSLTLKKPQKTFDPVFLLLGICSEEPI